MVVIPGIVIPRRQIGEGLALTGSSPKFLAAISPARLKGARKDLGKRGEPQLQEESTSTIGLVATKNYNLQ